MLKIIHQFNRWFDSLQEPRRCYIALLISSPFLICSAAKNPYIYIPGILWGIGLIIIRMLGK